MSRTLRILDETRISIDAARALLGTSDAPISMATVHRALRAGARTPDGGRVCLEHLKVNGKVLTSIEAIGRYVARTNGIAVEAI